MAQVGQVNTLEQVLRNHIGNGFFYMMFEKKNGNMREGIYKFGVRNKSKSYIRPPLAVLTKDEPFFMESMK